MRVLPHRRAVIEWAGSHHAYPLAKKDGGNEVKLARPGDDEAGWRRVGWEHFFGPLDREHRAMEVADDGSFDYRIVACQDLPREAFGPPWYQKLLHEVWLTRPAHD